MVKLLCLYREGSSCLPRVPTSLSFLSHDHRWHFQALVVFVHCFYFNLTVFCEVLDLITGLETIQCSLASDAAKKQWWGGRDASLFLGAVQVCKSIMCETDVTHFWQQSKLWNSSNKCPCDLVTDPSFITGSSALGTEGTWIVQDASQVKETWGLLHEARHWGPVQGHLCICAWPGVCLNCTQQALPGLCFPSSTYR